MLHHKNALVQLVQVVVLAKEGALAKADASVEVKAVTEAWCLTMKRGGAFGKMDMGMAAGAEGRRACGMVVAFGPADLSYKRCCENTHQQSRVSEGKRQSHHHATNQSRSQTSAYSKACCTSRKESTTPSAHRLVRENGCHGCHDDVQGRADVDGHWCCRVSAGGDTGTHNSHDSVKADGDAVACAAVC